MNKINLENRVAIVTGGAQGFGLAITKRFIESGARVLIWDKDTEYLNKVDLKNTQKIEVDVSNYKSVENAFAESLKYEKKIDILVNNAGISEKFSNKNLLNYWNRTISINLTAPYFLSYICLPFLKKAKNSTIVNITSLNGKIAMSNNPAYNASKGGLSALNACLAMDFSEHKIRVNAVSPGYIKTGMTNKSYNNKKAFKKRLDRMMIKNYGTPQDIANAVLYLSSNKSKYINATEIVVDGGLLKKGI